MLSYDYKRILTVALPLMAGTFIQSLVAITDAAILSRYSTISFDASGNAGLLYVTLFMGLTGMGDAAQIIIARRVGENQFSEIGTFFRSSLLLNAIISILFFSLIALFSAPMLLSYSKEILIAQEQIAFLEVRKYGFFLAAMFLGFNAYFLAIGKTWVIFVSTAALAATNILFDFLLIFGNAGFPEMGIQGAALASIIGEFVALILLFTFFLLHKERRRYLSNFAVSITSKHLLRLLKVGLPLMIQGFFALATWTIFFTWIEQRGMYELTVSQNIRAIYMLAFVPIFGFGATTKTYIAQYIQSGQKDKVKIIIQRIQLLTLFFLLLVFHGAFIYPEVLVSWINPDPTYIADSAYILRAVFGAVFFFAFFTPYFQTINGSGNTRATLIIEIAAICLYLSSAYLFIHVLELDILGIWFVEYVYFGALGLFSIIYLRNFNWKETKF
jgi:MATE family multidrug resistance protein